MKDHRIIGMPTGTRCRRIERLARGWRVWLDTNDYEFGTYLLLYDTGRILRITCRAGEGDDTIEVRPRDAEIRSGD